MSTLELPKPTKRTPSKKLPVTRARYALALVETGHEETVTVNDQKRLLAARLVTLNADGSLGLTVSGARYLHNVKG